jgi:uncharacterized protein (TIGR02466 family)
MDIKPLFPTPLIRLDLDSADILAELRRTILEREAASAGTLHSNDGGWQSADDFVAWGGNAGALLIASMRETVDRFTGRFEGGTLDRGGIDWRVQAWANVNRASAANHAHFHPGAFWSACFYVDDGGIAGGEALGGAIEFVDPRGALPLMYAPKVKMLMQNCVNAGLSERVYPSTGMLLIFPSWLAHCVTRYTGNGTRISIALNFCL